MKIRQLRSKVTDGLKGAFGKEGMKDFVRGFLPTEELLEISLKEICLACPANHGVQDYHKLSVSDKKKLDACRKSFFAVLLQSYLGKPGNEETELLYSYLKKCEECLFLGSSGSPKTSEKESKRPNLKWHQAILDIRNK
jgi:hypothetical protein